MKTLSAAQLAYILARQPAPLRYNPEGVDVLDAIGDEIILDPDNLAVLQGRYDFGAQKYGTVLQLDNGRDPIVDLIQEKTDSVYYAIQAYRKTGDEFFKRLALRDLDALTYCYDHIKRTVKA